MRARALGFLLGLVGLNAGAFTGTITAVEYAAGANQAGTVIRSAAASSAFVNGVRVVAARAAVSGATIALSGVTVRALPIAAAAVGTYCYFHLPECEAQGSELMDWFKNGPLQLYPENGVWVKARYEMVQKWKNISSSGAPKGNSPGDVCTAYMTYSLSAGQPARSFDSLTALDANNYKCQFYNWSKVNNVWTKNATTAWVQIGKDGAPVNSQVTPGTPATEEEVTQPQQQVTDAVLNNVPFGMAIPVSDPEFEKQKIGLGAPYPGTTPENGWEQDYAEVSPIPSTPIWSDATINTGTAKVDNPDTEAIEGPSDVSGGGAAVESKDDEPVDPCEIDPERLGCIKLGEAPSDEVPKSTQNVTFSAESVDLPSGCPAPLDIGHGRSLSYASACEAAETARPFVVALASLSALLLVAATVRRG